MSLDEQTPPPHPGALPHGPVVTEDPVAPAVPSDSTPAPEQGETSLKGSGHVCVMILQGDSEAVSAAEEGLGEWSRHGLIGRVLLVSPACLPPPDKCSGMSVQKLLSSADALVIRSAASGTDALPSRLLPLLSKLDAERAVTSVSVASVRLSSLGRPEAELEAQLLKSLMAPLRASSVQTSSITVGPARPSPGPSPWSQWSFGPLWDRHFLCSAPAPDSVPHYMRIASAALTMAGGWSFSDGPHVAADPGHRDSPHSAASGTVRLMDSATRAILVPDLRSAIGQWSAPARYPWPLPASDTGVCPAGLRPVPESFEEAVADRLGISDVPPGPAPREPRREPLFAYVPVPSFLRRAMGLSPAVDKSRVSRPPVVPGDFPVSDPEVWQLYRSLMFGLCDGGPMPAPVVPPTARVNGVDSRVVWTDPTPVCRPPGLAGTSLDEGPSVPEDEAPGSDASAESQDGLSADPFSVRLYRRMLRAADSAERRCAEAESSLSAGPGCGMLEGWTKTAARRSMVRRWLCAGSAVTAAALVLYAESRLGWVGSLMSIFGVSPLAPMRDSGADTIAAIGVAMVSVAALVLLLADLGSEARKEAEAEAEKDRSRARLERLRGHAVLMRSVASQYPEHEAAVAAVMYEPNGTTPADLDSVPEEDEELTVPSPDGSALRVWRATLDDSVVDSRYEDRWEERSSGHSDGWMSTLYQEAAEMWSRDYDRAVLGQWPHPDEDFSPAGSRTHQDRVTKEPLLSPRQHIAQDLPRVLGRLDQGALLSLWSVDDTADETATAHAEVLSMVRPDRPMTDHLSGPSDVWDEVVIPPSGVPDWHDSMAPDAAIPQFSRHDDRPRLGLVGRAVVAGTTTVVVSSPMSPDSLREWRSAAEPQPASGPDVV